MSERVRQYLTLRGSNPNIAGPVFGIEEATVRRELHSIDIASGRDNLGSHPEAIPLLLFIATPSARRNDQEQATKCHSPNEQNALHIEKEYTPFGGFKGRTLHSRSCRWGPQPSRTGGLFPSGRRAERALSAGGQVRCGIITTPGSSESRPTGPRNEAPSEDYEYCPGG